jgi:hypothetical protein
VAVGGDAARISGSSPRFSFGLMMRAVDRRQVLTEPLLQLVHEHR